MNTKDIPKIELKAVGEKVTLCVEQARKLPFGNYPEAEFCGTVGSGDLVVVVMPLKSAEKQLGNLNLGTMDAEGDFPDATGKYLTIKRSENKGQPSRPFWDIYMARAGEFEEGVPAPERQRVAAAGKRVQPPPMRAEHGGPVLTPPPGDRYDREEEFAEELRNDPQGVKAGAAQPRSMLKDPVTGPLGASAGNLDGSASQQLPLGDGPQLTEAERAEQKKRQAMMAMRRKFRALWEDEARYQLVLAATLQKENLGTLVVDGSSVNAAVATQWINFDRRGYV